MKKESATDWIPGIESETSGKGVNKSLICSILVSLSLFLLLPLSELVRDEEWIVREVESVNFQSPPPTKTKMEQKVEDLIREKSSPRPLEAESLVLDVTALSANLEVGPGDFKAQFSLDNFNPIAGGFEGELVFELHELDKNPKVIQRGSLIYPPLLKKRGVEGEVKLLIQINEKGKVKVLEVVSSTHPDFNKPSIKAAEGSIYEAPTKNGEPVKVQFYLPVRYSLLD